MAFLLLPKLRGPVLSPLNGVRLTFCRHLFSYFLLWSCSASVPFLALGYPLLITGKEAIP